MVSNWSKCKEDFIRILMNEGINAFDFATEMEMIEKKLLNKRKFESFKFFTRKLRKHETIDNFCSELNKLAVSSDFGDENLIKRLVIVKIISGNFINFISFTTSWS